MKFITKLDYIRYRKKYPEVMILAEEEEEYKIPTEEEMKYGQENIKSIDKKHDKMLKVLFSKKKEVARFLNQFLSLEEKIKEEQLTQCSSEFITKQYKEKQALETTSLFTSFMIMEKCKTKEEMLVYTKKIINKLKKEKSKELAEEIIKNIMALFFGKNIITKMLEELERKEEISMSPATKMLFDLQLEGEKRGIMKTIKETAQKMLKKNMDLKDIEEITGLTKEEIEKLQECI